jgi:transposase
MPFSLTDDQRRDLMEAMTATPRVRRWKRYRAIVLRGDGLRVPEMAKSLGCSQASVYAWTAAWRQAGVTGLTEGDHGGGRVKLGLIAEAILRTLLASNPQAHGHRATGWTVPLLRTELATQGTRVSERTIRRALHRLGYRWKRPRYILGRPDPEYAAKKGA